MITLSAEQAAVVAHDLTPLRVEAGAGTGKTTTLAHRVAGLMDHHEVAAHEVLGVTFTNKAAEELAERIAATGTGSTDPEQQVDVFTYHGFAAHLLSTHGALVGIERDVSVITPTFSRQLLEDAVRVSAFEHQDVTHRPTVTNNLLRLSNELADNLATPHDILSVAPEGDVDLKRHELARALIDFERLKRELGVVDYGDLIRQASELVVQHEAVRRALRDQYRCVLLDEYQDTNPAQRELFRTIFGIDCAVTAVGDPDQTIYEWRGATPDNFASFPTHFRAGDQPTPTMPLTINRRSGQLILDLANRLRHELEAAEPGPDLRAADDRPSAVQVGWYADARVEAEAIAAEAKHLHEQGVAWSDMAILFRKNKDMSIVRDALDEFGVPLQVANLGGLLGIPEIVEIRSWLRILADPEDSPAVARLLLGSQYRLGLADLLPLTRWSRSETADHESLDHTLVEALDHLDDLDVAPDLRDRLDEFRSTYRRLLTSAQGSTLVELTREILTVTSAWSEIDAMPYPSGLSARLNVHRFLDLVEDWSPLEGRPSLEAFLGYLELMAEDPVEELDTARVGSDDAVTLMTVHRAKGLEWDVVFLPALYESNFPGRPRALDDPATRHQSVPARLLLDPVMRERLSTEVGDKQRRDWLRTRHYDQEWRLAYVATTRARTHLIMSGAQWYGVPEPNKTISKPSPILDLARDLAGSSITHWETTESDRPEVLRYPPAASGPDATFGVAWDEALRSELQSPGWAAQRASELDVASQYDSAVEELQGTLFALPDPIAADPVDAETRVSVTGLVTYADCPKRFFWSDIDPMPRRPSEASRRGTLLHRRIELYSRGIVPFDELADDLYDHTPEDVVSDPRADPWESFESSRFATERPLMIEVPFEVRLDAETGAWIRGRIDAVYGDADHWEIVDFKSGRRSGRAAASVQLEAYAVAAANAAVGSAPPPSLAVTFAYLGDGLDVVTTEVTAEWLAEAEERLNGLVEDIQAEQFDERPSSACHGCDFLRFCAPGKAFVEAAD